MAKKTTRPLRPIRIEGRAIARSFWGKRWCTHLESFSDYANRLPRGRTYARRGSIWRLDIDEGRIEATVHGSRPRPYRVTIGVQPLPAATWQAIRSACTGQIGSILELLRGALSDRVMAVVSDPDRGLFPKPREIEFDCSCPDWAAMCKHVAAVLYGVGHRLDDSPELLFRLRGVDPAELIGAGMVLPDAGAGGADTVAEDQLGDIFGIDLDADASP